MIETGLYELGIKYARYLTDQSAQLSRDAWTVASAAKRVKEAKTDDQALAAAIYLKRAIGGVAMKAFD